MDDVELGGSLRTLAAPIDPPPGASERVLAAVGRRRRHRVAAVGLASVGVASLTLVVVPAGLDTGLRPADPPPHTPAQRPVPLGAFDTEALNRSGIRIVSSDAASDIPVDEAIDKAAALQMMDAPEPSAALGTVTVTDASRHYGDLDELPDVNEELAWVVLAPRSNGCLPTRSSSLVCRSITTASVVDAGTGELLYSAYLGGAPRWFFRPYPDDGEIEQRTGIELSPPQGEASVTAQDVIGKSVEQQPGRPPPLPRLRTVTHPDYGRVDAAGEVVDPIIEDRLVWVVVSPRVRMYIGGRCCDEHGTWDTVTYVTLLDARTGEFLFARTM